MNKYRKLVTIALVAGTGFMATHPADAWWGGDRWGDDDWWDRPGYYRHGSPYGRGGYPGYGWGGYPGYGGWGGSPYGWGGYPGYGWGSYAPAGSGSTQSTPAPPPRPE